jgi:hypothetical protein
MMKGKKIKIFYYINYSQEFVYFKKVSWDYCQNKIDEAKIRPASRTSRGAL